MTQHPPANEPPPEYCWRAEAARRMRYHPVLKTLGLTGFIWLFFVGYFFVLRHPGGPVTIMPLTWLDHAIPFHAWALAPYLTLWIYLGVTLGFMDSFRDMLAHGAVSAAVCVTGLLCFFLWPTAVPPTGIDTAVHPWFAMLQGVDATGNACPSLHVATAWFTALRLHGQLRSIHAPSWTRATNLVWCALIVYSTLATKQHVAIDALAGLLLGTAPALASMAKAKAFRSSGGIGG